ncbi:hypothetical protein QS306_10055 [Paraburkholderia bonniea]|uniref:hypothetical protein n=1 Tax=Paraburkholderia bonniea TaxID=2152891 RepID=UPI0012929B00|nr:hypothetical protein [Paraburkholderia bonniea]WJF89462.1 hypothetical protein QS306_10055 [Paraburkholderia bonniea]WJF92777.1 hypothetical protein QS308_10065 [Paraburkholderia bonniea]
MNKFSPLSVETKLIKVIHVRVATGSGDEGDPPRMVNFYYCPDGQLLACYDPLLGQPDSAAQSSLQRTSAMYMPGYPDYG